jgi:hypothetical protein
VFQKISKIITSAPTNASRMAKKTNLPISHKCIDRTPHSSLHKARWFSFFPVHLQEQIYSRILNRYKKG